jgi:tetratricopeptide (TPR) repeat protein
MQMAQPARQKTSAPSEGRQTVALSAVIVLGLIGMVLLAQRMDRHRSDPAAAFAEEQLYLKGPTAKRLSLAFNGLAADWYWMRSLQYMGRKVVNYNDTHEQQINLNDLGALDLRLLPSLLRMSTTLDPKFMAPYEYGAMILPTFNDQEAIALLTYGIQQNPDAWRLHQHLGYIYWQRHDYEKAGQVYAAGAKLPGAPQWLAQMSARVTAEGGSRRAAREMYQHLYDESNDDQIKQLLARRLMQVDSFEERDLIRRVLSEYSARFGRCVSSWKDIAVALRALRLRVDVRTGAAVDPAGTPYLLVKNGCDVDLDPKSAVPYK